MRRPVVAGVLVLLATPGCDRSESPAKADGADPTRSSADAIVRDETITPPREEKRGDARGLADRLRDITQDREDEDSDIADVPRVAIPATIPFGDIIIEHGCSHSMQPFGTGYWNSTTTVDLTRATIVQQHVEGDTRDRHAIPGTSSSEKRTETKAELGPSDVARIRDALDRVLAGGPYAPVHAVSEGIVCTLSLRVGEDTPFFSIDKCDPKAEDAVTRLIGALGVSSPKAAASPP